MQPSCRRQLEAMTAAHAATLLACEGRLSLAGHDSISTASILSGLAVTIAHGPLAVGLDPALSALFGQLWSNVALLVSEAVHVCASSTAALLVQLAALIYRTVVTRCCAQQLCKPPLPGTAGQGLRGNLLATSADRRDAVPLPGSTPCFRRPAGRGVAGFWAGGEPAGSTCGGGWTHACTQAYSQVDA